MFRRTFNTIRSNFNNINAHLKVHVPEHIALNTSFMCGAITYGICYNYLYDEFEQDKKDKQNATLYDKNLDVMMLSTFSALPALFTTLCIGTMLEIISTAGFGPILVITASPFAMNYITNKFINKTQIKDINE